MAGKARLIKAHERTQGKNALRQLKKRPQPETLNALQQAIIDSKLIHKN